MLVYNVAPLHWQKLAAACCWCASQLLNVLQSGSFTAAATRLVLHAVLNDQLATSTCTGTVQGSAAVHTNAQCKLQHV